MKFCKFRKQIMISCKNLCNFVLENCGKLNFSTIINTFFEIHDPKKLQFLKFFINQKKLPYFYDYKNIINGVLMTNYSC